MVQNPPKKQVSHPLCLGARGWKNSPPKSWPVAVSEPEVPIVGVSHHWVYPPEILKECHLPKDHWTLKTGVILRTLLPGSNPSIGGSKILKANKRTMFKMESLHLPIFQPRIFRGDVRFRWFTFGYPTYKQQKPLKMGRNQKRKGSSSNHQFSGTMLVSGRVSPRYQWKLWRLTVFPS